MTHSLHRRGSRESLKNDYVLLCTPAKGVNNNGAKEKLLRVLDIVMEIGPSNIGFYGYGSMLSGISIDEVKKNFHDNSRVRCTFDDKDKIREALSRINSEGMGLSITVSGLIDEVEEMGRELGLKPHTINIACGCYGKINRIPSRETLELSTMCGHGMISYSLVESVKDRLRTREIDENEAIRMIGEPCTCGIYNPTRARNILRNINHEIDYMDTGLAMREHDELSPSVQMSLT